MSSRLIPLRRRRPFINAARCRLAGSCKPTSAACMATDGRRDQQAIGATRFFFLHRVTAPAARRVATQNRFVSQITPRQNRQRPTLPTSRWRYLPPRTGLCGRHRPVSRTDRKRAALRRPRDVIAGRRTTVTVPFTDTRSRTIFPRPPLTTSD
jgi:hypothetical protein